MPPKKGKPGGAGDAVNVCIRVRPHTMTDGGDARTAVTIDDEFGEVCCRDPDGKKTDKKYAFDTVFSTSAEQLDVFLKVGQPMVDITLDGYNATLFTYGQTGSGKTYTIQGLPGAGVRKDQAYDIDKHKGLTPRVAEYLYDRMGELVDEDSSCNTAIEMGYLEIYNEKVRDLLVANSKDLDVREDVNHKPFVDGLSWKKCLTSEQVMKNLLVGNTRRQVASTKMNEVSSRSHSIVMIKVKVNYDPPKPSKPDTQSLLYIVDLAGSERQDKTGAEGETLTEAKNINKSLLMLGRAIHAFGEKGATAHVPLRDSKLTRLLKESFGGNSRTWMIATCSASPYNITETKSTLDYAANAKLVVNNAEQNRLARQLELGEQREMTKKLEAEVARLQEQLKTADDKAEARAKEMAVAMSKGQSASIVAELEELKVENARLTKKVAEQEGIETELRHTIAKGVKSEVAEELRKELDEARAEIANLKKELESGGGSSTPAGGGGGGHLAAPTGGSKPRSLGETAGSRGNSSLKSMKDLLDDPSAAPEERLKRMEGRALVESAGSFVRKKSFNMMYKQATGHVPKGSWLGGSKDISVSGGYSMEDLKEAKAQAIAKQDFAEAQRLSEEIKTMQSMPKAASMKDLQTQLQGAVSKDNFVEAQKIQSQINFLKMQQARENAKAMTSTTGGNPADSYAPTATPRPGVDAAMRQAMSQGGSKAMFVGRASISLKFLVASTDPPRSRYHTLPLECDASIKIDPSCPPQLLVNIYEMEKKAGKTDDGRMDFVVHVIGAKGIPKAYSNSVHCKYVFKWGEKDNYKSDEVKMSTDPDFDYKKRFAFPSITDQLRGWFNSENVMTFEVIGLGSPSNFNDPTRGAF